MVGTVSVARSYLIHIFDGAFDFFLLLASLNLMCWESTFLHYLISSHTKHFVYSFMDITCFSFCRLTV